MLKLTELSLENFGPFKGRQTIPFSAKGGVGIVYGENGRGKTSLLNAIRYALFGKILTRGSRELGLHKVGNWEAAQAKQFGFSVELKFSHGSDSYELQRLCRARPGVSSPASDGDYEEECFLKINGTVVGPEQRQATLQRLMPEQVSRFFLFDGELLQEYEELVRDESAMGHKITQAIERILGVPLLTDTRTILRDLYKKAERDEARAAQGDQRTREIGAHLTDLQAQSSHHETEIERLKSELTKLRQKRASLENALKRTERIRHLMEEREGLERQIVLLDQQRAEKELRLKEVMGDAWKGMLRRRVKNLQDDIQQKMAESQTQIAKKGFAEEMQKQMAEALRGGHCPTCSTAIGEDASRFLKKEIARLSQATWGAGAGEQFRKGIHLLQVLSDFSAADSAGLVQEIVSAIDGIAIKKVSLEGQIQEINDQTRENDQGEVRRIYADYDATVKEIGLVEQGLADTEKKLKDSEDTIKGLQKELARLSGADVSKERRRRELYLGLAELFNEGVGVYRDRLRKRVERDATQLFVRLTTEPEYTKLRINDSYGLTIVHQDGHEIPVRSAGVEHVVALSLMGALQKNAPLSGPIIMDSPFGRLDDEHTAHIVDALPTMAEQVVLLVYRSELHPELARKHLQGKLRSEYALKRVTARHTNLEPLSEVEA